MLHGAHPHASMSLRNSRELLTVAECLDALLAGDLPHLGDLLMQRFNTNGHRREQLGLAQHMDFIPTSSSNSTSTSEMRAAQHTQMAQLKLNCGENS